VRSRSAAALALVAAICALLVAPSAATAQLRCNDPEADTLIRRVSFEGNHTFTDNELALHVVSTATDFTRRIIDNRVIPAVALVGAGIGLGSGGNKAKNAVVGAAVGAALGLGISRLSGTPRCLRPGTLAGDILNLGGFYRDEGFKDVRVDTATHIDGRWVDVTFSVTEGDPVLVDTLSIIGWDSTTMGSLPTSLNSRKGGRYSPTLTQEDMDTLETRLHDNGYPEGRVDRDIRFVTPYRTSVTLNVTPGPRARIGAITIDQKGLQGRPTSIKESVIRSQLRFGPGDWYSERTLFESERRYYRVGTFVSAEVAPDVSHLEQDSLVDVKVNLVEDLMHSGSVEPALGTLDCFRVRGNYSDKGFLGGVNRLDVSGAVSKVGLAKGTRWNGLNDACVNAARLLSVVLDSNEISSRQLNYNTTVRFSRPVPLPGGLLPSLSAYTERRGGYQAYLRTTLIGGALSVSKGITRTIVFEGSYNLEYGHTDADQTVLCFLFRACDESARAQLTQGDKRLAVLGARFSRDRRNNPDSTSAGTLVRLDLRSSNRLFLTDPSLEFQKAVVDASWYHRLGVGVVALRARAGIIGGGQETDGALLPPPQERLYVGGETTVRGFRQNQLGPLTYVTSDDTTQAMIALNAPDEASRIQELQKMTMRIIPAGGNRMFIGNLEYRLPGPFVNAIQTILFLDAGALSTKGITTVSGSNQFRFTPGVAIKYFSPVGAVQVNLGYNSYDLLAGPVFSDQFMDPAKPGQRKLTCISGVVGGVCQPLAAVSHLRRLTLTVAFPPDF
jgi:outer membrane protein insertion porin family/translocation and assembly module TamA